jgi:hypothetical protein
VPLTFVEGRERTAGREAANVPTRRRSFYRLEQWHPNSSLAQFVVRLRTNGLVCQEIDRLSTLLDISFGRLAFVRALGKNTNFWKEFTRPYLARFEMGTNADDVLQPLLQRRRLEVAWCREWAAAALMTVAGRRRIAQRLADPVAVWRSVKDRRYWIQFLTRTNVYRNRTVTTSLVCSGIKTS